MVVDGWWLMVGGETGDGRRESTYFVASFVDKDFQTSRGRLSVPFKSELSVPSACAYSLLFSFKPFQMAF